MENIVVDPSSGLVGVSSMVKCANPNVNAGSILRSVNGVLQDDSCGTTTKLAINRKSTVVANLNTCNYILDNLPGQRWDAWRRESGEEFKRSLAEHVERVRTGVPEVAEATDQVETKSSVLEKSLRTIGIIGSIRVDEASGKGSVIDVIKLLCPGATGDYAKTALSRVIAKDRDDHVGSDRNVSTSSISIADRVDYIQINGKGRTTPVSDAKTITEIIWLLPARAAKEFRRQSAETICRVLSGDTSICAEIESRCAALQSSEEGRGFQNFMSGESNDESPVKRARIGPPIMELATDEQYDQFVQVEVQHQLQTQRLEKADLLERQRLQKAKSLADSEISAVMKFKEAFEQIRPLEPREMIELCDRMTDIQHRTFRRMALMHSTTTPPTDAVVVATPAALATSEPALANSAPTDPGVSVPTPECHTAVRGDEISIAMVSTQLGVSLGERAGQVGKRMKALYAARYGRLAAANIPKRTTIFRGKPFQENTYFARDKDLMEQAIREVNSRN